MLTFEIFPDEVACETRVIKGKDGKPDRQVYDQFCYLLKGRQTIQLTVTHNSLLEAYPAGVYTIHDDSFEIENSYGRGQLKLNNFKFKLTPLTQVDSKPKTEKSSSNY
ncbi:single-stranded DNA-binding protein [Shewanella baltica]|uniref:single-stranded DNA-binding protein n=1 Tax=Shewanella baltica TaxID=62322 RepID=UPI0002185C71|nr:single-stranded DNA-binding protein [Shewanella baltica]AEH14011.1 Helix-destabilizing protein [Shewanella baltica OS117]